MNYLAHLHLSGSDPELIVGNFIGDFVKGKKVENYPKGIARGIYLHRTIDYFTDTHPIVAKSKLKLRKKYRHYSGVIVDMFYDHFLASDFNNYHHATLEDFTKGIYQTLNSYHAQMPKRANIVLSYMMHSNWLLSYATVEGITSALNGMAKRTKFVSLMDHASKELTAYYDEFKQEFEEFYPQLIDHCQTFLHNFKE